MTAKGTDNNLQIRLMIFEKLYSALHDIVLELVQSSGFDRQTSSKVVDTLNNLKGMLIEPQTQAIPKKIKPKPTKKVVEEPPSVRLTRNASKEVASTSKKDAPKPVKEILSASKSNDEVGENVEKDKGIPTVLVTDEPPISSETAIQRSKLITLAPRRRTIFMSGLAINNTVEDIRKYVFEILDDSISQNEIHIFNISPRSNCSHTSFKLVCPASVFEKLLEVFREDGIVAREFQDHRKANENIPKNGVALPPSIKM